MRVYPISEVFESVQGEGAFTGTRMTFIRLAGCTVGKPFPADKKIGLAVFQEECHSWTGEAFACDTNYRKHSSKSVGELMAMEEVLNARHVCITGGEPLMHNIDPIVSDLCSAGIRVHIETSGTKLISDGILNDRLFGSSLHPWITVSPKKGCLDEMLRAADELKILVDAGTFDVNAFMDRFGIYLPKVWVQPVNGLDTVDRVNLKLCLKLCAQYKLAGVSAQLHKFIDVR